MDLWMGVHYGRWVQGYMDGTRGYYRVLPLGRTVPHIHRVYNIIWTSGETAAQSWYTPLRQGGIYPAKYLATSGPYHNPQSPFYYPSATTTIGSWWHSIVHGTSPLGIVSLVPPAIDVSLPLASITPIANEYNMFTSMDT